MCCCVLRVLQYVACVAVCCSILCYVIFTHTYIHTNRNMHPYIHAYDNTSLQILQKCCHAQKQYVIYFGEPKLFTISAARLECRRCACLRAKIGNCCPFLPRRSVRGVSTHTNTQTHTLFLYLSCYLPSLIPLSQSHKHKTKTRSHTRIHL